MSLALIQFDDAQAVLVHVPKTGGTSIRRGRQVGSAVLYTPKEAWKRLPSFGIMRDPFARMESCWHDFRFLRPLTKLSFPKFVRWAANVVEENSRQVIEDPRTIEHHVALQTDPVHGIRWAKTLGRTYSLQSDFDRFCEKYGLNRILLPRLRSSKRCPKALWTDELRDIVRLIYADDFEYLRTAYAHH